MHTDKIRVIIVDDHEMVRATWKMLLHEKQGIEVIAECASGAEAIELASTMQPDVMLIDVNMAPVNGFEATRKIHKAHPQIRIIGVSINNQASYARNMMQLGAKAYVTKNSSREEMIFAIMEVMKGKTYICKDMVGKMNE